MEVEAETDVNSKIPNKSNGIGSSNSESSNNTVITLQLLEEQVRKMKTLQMRINGEVTEADAEAEAEIAAEAEEKAEAEEDANSEIPNNSNVSDSSSSNSESNYVENKILNRCTNENENKIIGNNVGQDGAEDGVTTEAQQQKCENARPTDNMTPHDDSNEKKHQRHERDLDRINQCQCAHVIRDNADNNVIPSQRRQQCNSEPTTTTPKS